ncbi:MAG: metallophosphoesterase [Chloroflexota bacterium]
MAGIGASLAAYAILREPTNVQLDRLTIQLPYADGCLPDDGLKILHLSDTHFQGLEWRERSKIERIRRLTKGISYDLLIHTGDFWHNEAGLKNLLALLDVLPPAKLGAYGVMGNHDYACYSHADALSRNWDKYQTVVGKNEGSTISQPSAFQNNGYTAVAPLIERQSVEQPPIKLHEYPLHAFRFVRYFLNMPFELERTYYNDTYSLKDRLASRGVTILDNQSVHLCQEIEPGRTVDLFLAGVDDVCEGKPCLESAFANVPNDAPAILLSHNPDILEEDASRRAELILSGHTHGGQIVLPLLGAAHTHSAHLGRKEAAGYMRRGKTQVYISRGIGEGIPLRFGAGPQITLITVKG